MAYKPHAMMCLTKKGRQCFPLSRAPLWCLVTPRGGGWPVVMGMFSRAARVQWLLEISVLLSPFLSQHRTHVGEFLLPFSPNSSSISFPPPSVLDSQECSWSRRGTRDISDFQLAPACLITPLDSDYEVKICKPTALLVFHISIRMHVDLL